MELLRFRTVGREYAEHVVLRVRSDEHGEYWKVVKLVRLLRNPREYSQVETAIEMHRDIVSATRSLLYARQILVGANILRPQLGILWCYGVLVADYDLDRAKEFCDGTYDAMLGLLQGTYRQGLYRSLIVEEVVEVFKRLKEFRHGVALKGIPEPRQEPNRLYRFLGFKTGLRIVEMLEEVVRGLMDREFVFVVMLEPARVEQLIKLLRRVAEERSKYSTFQESSGISFSVVVPWGYTGSYALQRGESRGESKSGAQSQSEHESHGVSYSHAEHRSRSRVETLVRTEGEAHTKSHSTTRGETWGFSESLVYTDTHSVSRSHGVARTRGWSRSVSTTSGGSTTTTTGKVTPPPTLPYPSPALSPSST